MLPTSSLTSHGGGRRLMRSSASMGGYERSDSAASSASSPLSSSASSSPPRTPRSHGGRSLAAQLRVFLCGCGLLYVFVLWHSGLWTHDAASASTTVMTTKTQQLHGRAAQEIRPTTPQDVLSRGLETPQTISSRPAATTVQRTPSAASTSRLPTPTTHSKSSTATRVLVPSTGTTPSQLVPQTKTTPAVEPTVSVIPASMPSSTSTSMSALTSTPTSTPASTLMPTSTPTETPVAGGMDVQWLLSLMKTSPPSPYSVSATGTTIVSYEAHMERMNALEDKRLRSLAAIGVLKNKLHKIKEQLDVHSAIIAEEDAKLVTELPKAYKQQSKQSKFKCLGWRATADCDPRGKRVPSDDRSCLQNVPAKMSGYCEVEDTATKQRFRVMLTACDTLRWDATLRCYDAWHFPNFAIQSLEALKNASAEQQEQHQKPVVAQQPTRGVVLVVYPKMLPSAYATLRTLRRLRCSLPVELWYKTSELQDAAGHPIIRKIVEAYGPLTLRAIEDKNVKGFTTKIHAIRHSGFDHVLFLDADNVPVKDPTYLFDLPQFQSTGAVFWPDFWHPNHTIFALHPRSLVWEYLDLDFVDMFEQESGQLVIDKTRAHKAFALLHLYAHHQPNLLDKFKIVHGDKDLFRLAWLKSNTSFYMIDRPPAIAGNVRGDMFCGQSMVQYDPQGDVLFLHRNAKKLEGRHPKPTARSPLLAKAGEIVAVPQGEQEMEVDPEIWTHLLQLKPTSSRANYTVEIYEANKDFPKGQWCYGKPTPNTPHFNTFRFADMPFRDVENEIRAYAMEATDLIASSQQATTHTPTTAP